jgi:hypothetical protein
MSVTSWRAFLPSPSSAGWKIAKTGPSKSRGQDPNAPDNQDVSRSRSRALEIGDLRGLFVKTASLFCHCDARLYATATGLRQSRNCNWRHSAARGHQNRSKIEHQRAAKPDQ